MIEPVTPDRPAATPDRRRSSVLQTIGTVGWSFFGVRKASDHEKDTARLNPVHVIVAGLVGAAAFVGGLLLLVEWVLSSGVAK